jgi:hypothetical protein
MRRLLVSLGLVAAASVLTLAPAGAHGDYAGGWSDPAPGARLDGLRGISGAVGHAHGIQAVSLNLVVPEDPDAPDECAPTGGPWAPVNGGGAPQVSFTFQVTFPCNIVYRVEAAAQAGSGEGSTFDPDPAPSPFQMPTLIAVAIPPEPVDDVEATLTGTARNPEVEVAWSPGEEPDLKRYVITRDGEVLGEVYHGEPAVFVDEDPPSGRSIYEVTAVRSAPGGDVAGGASGADVNVPEPPPEEDDEDERDPSSDDDGDDDSSDDDDGDDDDGDDGDGPSLGSSTGSGGGSQPGSIGSSSGPATGGGPPTTLDTGFSETLPFGEPGPGRRRRLGRRVVRRSRRAPVPEQGDVDVLRRSARTVHGLDGDPLRHPARCRRRDDVLTPTISSSSAIAPSLSSGSLPLPHLGDCTQDGQPRAHGQSRRASSVRSRSSAADS